MTSNYLIRGIEYLKEGFFIGIPLYLIIVIILHVLKIRKSISWKCIFELAFCIYAITLLKITGIFELTYSLSGIFNYNLIPFIGSSIIPVLLNFILFVPYGFLLPLVFRSFKWNFKNIIFISGLTSFIIELLQMFGGRYAETDDLLINTLGAFSGFVIYSCICMLKKDNRKAMKSFALLCLALTICFAGIYYVGDNEEDLPDGLSAVEGNIAEIHVFKNGENRTIDAESEAYHYFSSQISNCGGHLLEPENISENMIWNNDCFIEIIYTSPQNIHFVNADDFSIENADRLLYNADQNLLYWEIPVTKIVWIIKKWMKNYRNIRKRY